MCHKLQHTYIWIKPCSSIKRWNKLQKKKKLAAIGPVTVPVHNNRATLHASYMKAVHLLHKQHFLSPWVFFFFFPARCFLKNAHRYVLKVLQDQMWGTPQLQHTPNDVVVVLHSLWHWHLGGCVFSTNLALSFQQEASTSSSSSSSSSSSPTPLSSTLCTEVTQC